MIISSNTPQKEIDKLWLKLEIEKLKFDRKYKPKFKKILKSEYKKAIDAFENSNGNVQIVESLINEVVRANPVFDLYLELYKDVGTKYYKRAARRKIKEETDIENIIIQYLQTEGGQRITTIVNTTIENIQKALIYIVQNQLTTSEAIAYLKRTFNFESDYRAERIVRTEVNTAANFGSLEGAKATGLTLNKIWLSARDKRVRGVQKNSKFSHIGMNGQKQPLNLPFTEPKTLQKLMFPCDSSNGASAGNTINCRCTMIYEEI